MIIPKEFTIACIKHTVEIQDEDDGMFGHFSPAGQKIVLARYVKSKEGTSLNNDGYIAVSEELMCNTFLHELFHAFEFYYDGNVTESLVQSFANLLYEYETTKC